MDPAFNNKSNQEDFILPRFSAFYLRMYRFKPKLIFRYLYLKCLQEPETKTLYFSFSLTTFMLYLNKFSDGIDCSNLLVFGM